MYDYVCLFVWCVRVRYGIARLRRRAPQCVPVFAAALTPLAPFESVCSWSCASVSMSASTWRKLWVKTRARLFLLRILTPPQGLYIDPHGPMAYDLFPRYFIVSMLERGYNGMSERVTATTSQNAIYVAYDEAHFQTVSGSEHIDSNLKKK